MGNFGMKVCLSNHESNYYEKMRGLIFIILLLLPMIGFGQAEKRYRSIIVDSLKALNGGRVDVKDTLLLDSLAVYNTDLSSQYTSRSLVDSAFVGTAISNNGHDPVTLSGTPDYITLSGQDIIRGLIDIGTDITGSHTGDVTGATALTIANKAVEIVMLDDGTDGELITWDASGVATTVSVGSNGQVLTSNGAGSEPTFQAAGGVSFGADNQIPFMNVGGNDFDYSGNLKYVTNELQIGGSNFGRFRLLNSSGSPVVAMTADFNSFFNQDVSIGHTTVPASGNNLDVVGGIIMSIATSIPSDNSFLSGDVFTLRGRYDSDPTGGVTLANFDIGIQTIMTSAGASPTGHLAFTVNGNTGLTVDESQTTTTIGINATSTDFSFIATDNVTTELFKIRNDGQTIVEFEFSTTKKDITLGVAATTFATTGNVMQVTGDGGGNTIATITGALSGQYLIMIFVDGNVTITDDNSHASNSVDLSAAFTGADDTTIHLIYDGTSWYEISRSTN